MLALCLISLIYDHDVFPLDPACLFASICVFHMHTSYQSDILGLEGDWVNGSMKMYNFLNFRMNLSKHSYCGQF